MYQTLKTTALLFVFCIFCSMYSKAQDVIIKNDKTEMKSKVTEISETLIKYKKWDNLDGPVYSISKNEVFMIVYANGQREIIKQPTPDVQQNKNSTLNANTTTSDGSLESQINQTTSTKIDTTINYENIKIKYKPRRLMAGLQTPFSLGLESEFRVVKNILNVGVSFYYAFPKDVISDLTGYLYASIYAPINRLTEDYKHQDEGLFIFVQPAYGGTDVTYQDIYGKTQTLSSYGFSWRVGADYFFSKGLGISISSYKFNTLYAGIVGSF